MNDKLIIDKGIYNNIDTMENTLNSFLEAFKKGYSVKSKVQYLLDGTFILFEEDALERFFKLKDDLKKLTYDDIEYISKYEVFKLDSLLNNINDNIVYLEIANFNKKTCNLLLKKIKDYSKNVVVLSMNCKILKFFKKHNFKVMLKIKRKNKHLLNSIFKPDIYLIDNGLLDRKRIKKLKEEYLVYVNKLKENEIEFVLEIYDNAVINF